MNTPNQTRNLTSNEVKAEKASAWTASIRGTLQRKADDAVQIGELVRIGLHTAPDERQHIHRMKGSIDPGQDHFLTELEKKLSIGEMQDTLSGLEDRRQAFMQLEGSQDIGVEQLAVMRAVLDTPDFYQQ